MTPMLLDFIRATSTLSEGSNKGCSENCTKAYYHAIKSYLDLEAQVDNKDRDIEMDKNKQRKMSKYILKLVSDDTQSLQMNSLMTRMKMKTETTILFLSSNAWTCCTKN